MALTLKSQRQVQTDILNAIISRLGLTDVNPGSVLDLLTQSIAQEDFNQYVQMSQIVRLVDLDATTGEDLANRAFEYGLTRTPPGNATGQVNIIRQVNGVNYVKVSTTFVSAGVLAPSIGDTTLNLNDARRFGSTFTDPINTLEAGDSLVIGRGLSNEEVRTIVSVALSPGGNTYVVVVDNPLSNNHSFTEEVTFIPVAQVSAGNIEISAGTVVSVPASGVNLIIEYQTQNDQTIFPGDSTVTNVDVRAAEPGLRGNVGSGTINTIDFVGLSVTNTSAFTTGTDLETDESLRDRIRSHIQSLSRGTQQAILNATVGVVDSETSKRVVSANVILPQVTSDPVKIFIDDGTGFEPSFLPRSFETIVESASEGTARLQLDFAPLVKASIESANAEPFDLSAITSAPELTGLRLTIAVGAVEETISLLLSDIEFPATVRSEEIVKVINNKSTIAEARTSQNGTRIVITGIAETNEDIFIDRPSTIPMVEDLNTYVQFTNNEQSTLYLYKNDKLLTKDGTTASVVNGGTSTSFTFPVLSSLRIVLDGKDQNFQTVIFNRMTDNRLSGSVAPSMIATIINEQISGAVADTISNGAKVRISTLTILSANGSVAIGTPSSGVDANTAGPNFGFVNSTGGNAVTIPDRGKTRDYTLNKELGTIELVQPLITGESVTAGNIFSRANIRTPIAVTQNTRINAGVGFTITFDGDTAGSKTLLFADDRFAASYIDNDALSRSNTFYGFDKGMVTTVTNFLPQRIVDYINKQIYPEGKASLRTLNDEVFIEITTNTYSSNQVRSSEAITSNGTIQFSNPSSLQLGIWSGVPMSLIENERPHQAFRENGVTLGNESTSVDLQFSPSDTLIAVMNNDQANGTFVLPLGYFDTIATETGGNTTSFTGSAVKVEFGSGLFGNDTDYNPAGTGILPTTRANGKNEIPVDANLNNYYLAMTGKKEEVTMGVINLVNLDPTQNRNCVITSANANFNLTLGATPRAASGISQVVANQTNNVATYSIGAGVTASTPPQFGAGDFMTAGIGVGDLVTFEGMSNSVNDGTFVIQTIIDNAPSGTAPTLTVINSAATDESGSSGTAILAQRRRVAPVAPLRPQGGTGFDVNGPTGVLTVSSAFRDPIQSDDATSKTRYALIPSTLDNLTTIFNNTRLTSLSLSADVAASDSAQRLQIASLLQGSAGFVEVTGGIGNTSIEFTTEAYRGLQGYNYYTGLLARVHKTIYGDDQDLATFPGVGAAGVQFQILAPTVTEIILELDVTLQEGISIAAVENEVNTAITGYINGLGVGENVIVEELRARSIRISGITDVVITRLVGGTNTNIVENIVIADNEIARIKVSDITLG